ncbi:hypothetical protein [Desulfurispira natronophila]|uniref:Uncharacterized protein n=1 Tax=Desulfurispira natronophila TaxID=682562 RepID=A0A7W7Y3T9_9BACT|nr:hypothetical protein [Desulfurispira natronophila]MBB5021547.1 hypothetical protein [Desulfurispira natronophila]
MFISVIGAGAFAGMELYNSFNNYRQLQQQIEKPPTELSVEKIRFTQPMLGSFIHLLFALVCFLVLEAFGIGLVFLFIASMYFYHSLRNVDQAAVLREAYRQAGAEQFMRTVRLSLILTSVPYVYFLLRIIVHLGQ